MSYASVIFDGRLGNNLFQLACLMSYCKKYSKNPIIHEWKYSKYFKNLPEHLSDVPKSDSVYIEPAFSYNEIPFFQNSVAFIGFFQSDKYQEGLDVNELFELKDEYKSYVKFVYDCILQPFEMVGAVHKEKAINKIVAIHVRRSDYLNPGTFEYHGVLDMDYYNRAIKALCGDNTSDVLFIVCSDDIAWCKENFNHLPNVHFSEGENEITDMYLMSLCDSIVIANSSFSWWSARLGDKNKGKVAPSKWFSGANLKTDDIYYPNMIII